ncbi:MAG: hypothetical protein ACK5Q5_24200 [Planctomycetaceae bacterium]
MPLTGGEALPAEPVRLERRFHRPTNLDVSDRVVLILPTGAQPRLIALNSQPLTDVCRLGDSRAWDLTSQLQPGNQLRLEFADARWCAALRQPVQLGIMPDVDGSWWDGLPSAG